MQWFKFYGAEYLSDPKMLALSAARRSCWVTLLCYAAAADEGGVVRHVQEDTLMMQAGVSPMHEEWDDCKGVLAIFAELGMIDVESNGALHIRNWRKRQESYLTNAERQQRYRDNQKRNAGVTRQRNESNARIEENRIEKKRNASNEAGDAGSEGSGELSLSEQQERTARMRANLSRAKKI